VTPDALRLASAFAAAGFPPMAANVLIAVLTSERGAATAEELAGELGASPAAVSGAVRYLMTVGMIARHRAPGERRYVYELPASWYGVSLNNGALYERLAATAESAAAGLEGAARDRVLDMVGFFRFVRARIPELVSEWEALRPRP
jgi:predicted ArsR family transcriptional regulator